MSIFAELKRRNVFRVGVAYLVGGWFVLQIADVVFPALALPAWSITLVTVLLVIGFLAALVVSWVYELTPEGLKRESEVDRARSVTGETGRRLDLVTIAMVVAGVSLLLVDRFLLERPGETPPPMPIERADQVAEVSVATIDDSIPIIAVLPFKATGSDDGGFLASGLHDDLLTRLAKLDAFKVISRTSMMEYADSTRNLRQIGEELGAGYILEGGVQALGNRVRINAQLIDARADQHLWAETYDRELSATNLFDIQAELAVSIAGQLQITLSPSDRALMAEVPTRSTGAYTAYLRGLELDDSGGFNTSNLEAVAAAFEEAVRLDPEFALAWAQLSVVRTELVQLSEDAETREAALAALAKARVLQPDLQEVELAWVSYLYRVLHEYEQALEALEAVGEQSALSVSSLRLKSFLYRRVGRFRDAYKTMLEAQRLGPRSIDTVWGLVDVAISSDNCEAADGHARTALSLAPDRVDVRAIAAEYELECTGDARRASELLRDVEFESKWQLWTARNAAQMERDYRRLLELSRIPQPEPAPIDPIIDLLLESEALRGLGRVKDAAATLDTVAEALATLEQEGTHDRDAAYADAMIWYYSLRRDAHSTRRWIEESRRRTRDEFKGDRFFESIKHLWYAGGLADAGLQEEAIAELRVMFEEPGGYGFRYVDALPVFDALEDHSGYIELRQRYGDAR
jgi:TolB-like protein